MKGGEKSSKKENFLQQQRCFPNGEIPYRNSLLRRSRENPFEHFRARIYLIILDDGGCEGRLASRPRRG